MPCLSSNRGNSLRTLPHRGFEMHGEKQSMLDSLSYTPFSLLIAKNLVSDIEGLAVMGVAIVNTSDFPLESFPPNQALLVHPEDHIRAKNSKCLDRCCRDFRFPSPASF